MKILPWKCDAVGCSSIKGESNHWHLVIPVDLAHITWRPGTPLTQDKDYGPRFLLIPWDDAAADLKGVKHYCSEQCCLFALSKWLAQQQENARRVNDKNRSQCLRAPCQTPDECDYEHECRAWAEAECTTKK